MVSFGYKRSLVCNECFLIKVKLVVIGEVLGGVSEWNFVVFGKFFLFVLLLLLLIKEKDIEYNIVYVGI